MKKYHSIFLILFFVSISMSANGQQTSLNTLYNQNNFLINPANAGLENCYSAYFNHRNQWTGINGSPVRNVLTFDGQVRKKHGIGVNLGMFEAGLLRNFNLQLTYAYHVQLSAKSKLSFGVSAGLIQQSFAFTDAIVTDYTDNAIAGGNFAASGFTSNAGILFTTDRLRLGVALPQFISSGLAINNIDQSERYQLILHSTIHSAYDLVNTDNWTVTPSVLYRNAAFVGNQIDAGVRGMWKSTLGLGAMYRSNYGMIGILELNLFEKINLSYGYGFGSGNLTGLSSGSHEVMLGLKFCKDTPPMVNQFEEEAETVEIKEVEVQEIIEETPEIEEEEFVEEIVEAEVAEEIVEEEKPEVVEPEPAQDAQKDDEVVPQPLPIVPRTINIDSLNKTFMVDSRILLYELSSIDNVTSANEAMVIQTVSEILKAYPYLNVQIMGHTCDIGEDQLNKTIGQGRANRAKQQLIKKGIPANRLTTFSAGETKPIVPNTNESNRSKNRRVGFEFVEKW